MRPLDAVIVIVCMIGAVIAAGIVGAAAQMQRNPPIARLVLDPLPVPTPRFECVPVWEGIGRAGRVTTCCCVFIRPRWSGESVEEDREPVSCFQGRC